MHRFRRRLLTRNEVGLRRILNLNRGALIQIQMLVAKISRAIRLWHTKGLCIKRTCASLKRQLYRLLTSTLVAYNRIKCIHMITEKPLRMMREKSNRLFLSIFSGGIWSIRRLYATNRQTELPLSCMVLRFTLACRKPAPRPQQSCSSRKSKLSKPLLASTSAVS